jgi:hypothetical protein
MEATGLSEPVEARLLEIIQQGKCTRKEFDQQTLKVPVLMYAWTFPDFCLRLLGALVTWFVGVVRVCGV